MCIEFFVMTGYVYGYPRESVFTFCKRVAFMQRYGSFAESFWVQGHSTPYECQVFTLDHYSPGGCFKGTGYVGPDMGILELTEILFKNGRPKTWPFPDGPDEDFEETQEFFNLPLERITDGLGLIKGLCGGKSVATLQSVTKV